MRGSSFQCYLLLLGASLAGVSAAETVKAETNKGPSEWPTWRGPNTTGVVSNSPKLLDSWPKEGPKQLWKSAYIPASNTDSGFGCPIVADGKVFIYAAWQHPIGGSDDRHFRPVTAEILSDMGYLPDLSEDLAVKIEEARLKRPVFNPGYHFYDNGISEKTQLEKIPAVFKGSPELEKYTIEFLTTLPPKDAEKYGPYVKRRFCMGGGGGNLQPFTWDQLKKMNAYFKDKEYTSHTDLIHDAFDHDTKSGVRLTENDLGPFAIIWDRCTKLTDTVICLDAASGKELWKKEFPYAGSSLGKNKEFGTQSSPAVWGGKCYVSGFNGLYCFSAKDGAVLWQVKGEPSHASTLVADGVVIYCAGGVALDAESGKVLWKDCWCGPMSPVLWKTGGKSYVVCGQTCFDLKTGKVAWKGAWDLKYGITPVIEGDILIAASGAYKLFADKAEQIWKMPPTAADATSSPVIYQDHVYWCHSWYDDNNWYCVDLKTGQQNWKQKPQPNDCCCTSPILADGKIIHVIGLGHQQSPYQVEMLQATPEKYVLLSTFSPGAAPLASPAVAGGKLYLRLVDGVGCYDLTAP